MVSAWKSKEWIFPILPAECGLTYNLLTNVVFLGFFSPTDPITFIRIFLGHPPRQSLVDLKTGVEGRTWQNIGKVDGNYKQLVFQVPFLTYPT